MEEEDVVIVGMEDIFISNMFIQFGNVHVSILGVDDRIGLT